MTSKPTVKSLHPAIYAGINKTKNEIRINNNLFLITLLAIYVNKVDTILTITYITISKFLRYYCRFISLLFNKEIERNAVSTNIPKNVLPE